MDYKEELYHYGIKGQKWGIRRYQNEDGSVTEVGKKRYSAGKLGSELNKADRKLAKFKMKEAVYSHKQKKAENRNNEKGAERNKSKAKEYKELIKDGELRTKELINLAKEKNYTVDSYYRGRSPHYGRDLTLNLISPLLALPFEMVDVNRYYGASREAGGAVEGNKYKVYRKDT